MDTNKLSITEWRESHRDVHDTYLGYILRTNTSNVNVLNISNDQHMEEYIKETIPKIRLGTLFTIEHRYIMEDINSIFNLHKTGLKFHYLIVDIEAFNISFPLFTTLLNLGGIVVINGYNYGKNEYLNNIEYNQWCNINKDHYELLCIGYHLVFKKK